MKQDFAAVIFDNDGTLVDPYLSLVRAWTEWAYKFEVTSVELADWNGHSTADIVQALVAPEMAEEATRAILELEVANVFDVVPQPGAMAALQALPQHQVAIATSSTRDVATARLKASGLPIPSIVVTADDIKRAKPDPEIFQTAARKLGVAPEDCLVVEDAVAGIAAAKAAGCSVIAVCTTTKKKKLNDADAVVRDLTQVKWQVSKSRIGVTVSKDHKDKD